MLLSLMIKRHSSGDGTGRHWVRISTKDDVLKYFLCVIQVQVQDLFFKEELYELLSN